MTYLGFNSGLANWICDLNGCSLEVEFIPDGTELVHKTLAGIETIYLTRALFIEERLTDVTGDVSVPTDLDVASEELVTNFTKPTYREQPTATLLIVRAIP